jgi:hypothetical protein
MQSGVPVFGNDSFFSGKNFALPGDKQSLNEWFDTSQFLPFPGLLVGDGIIRHSRIRLILVLIGY